MRISIGFQKIPLLINKKVSAKRKVGRDEGEHARTNNPASRQRELLGFQD